MIPIKHFHQHQINPVPGSSFNFDGKLGKVLTVSGGRVLIDFNNPLAGKDVKYEIEVKRKVDKIEEKIDAVNEFLFRKKIPFEIKDDKIILKFDKQLMQLGVLFKDKYKEIFNKEVEFKEIDEKPSTK